jgi:hypothetical protein
MILVYLAVFILVVTTVGRIVFARCPGIDDPDE